MTLFIGLLGKTSRTHATIYLSHLDPTDDWDEFERNNVELRHRDWCITGTDAHMPADIAIGVLTNVLQAAGISYKRVDL